MIDRDEEKAGPQIYGMPAQKIEVELQLLSKDEKSGEILQIADPDDGFDISFTKKGSKKTTDYKGVRIARDSSPLSDRPKRQEEWIDYIVENPLPDSLNFYENDYLEDIYGGKAAKKDEDEDAEDAEDADEPKSNRDRKGRPGSRDEDEGTSRRPARSSGKPKRDEEEEEEPEDEDNDDNGKGSKAPAKRARRDADEDAEDDPPRGKGRARKDDAEEDERAPHRHAMERRAECIAQAARSLEAAA